MIALNGQLESLLASYSEIVLTLTSPLFSKRSSYASADEPRVAEILVLGLGAQLSRAAHRNARGGSRSKEDMIREPNEKKKKLYIQTIYRLYFSIEFISCQ